MVTDNDDNDHNDDTDGTADNNEMMIMTVGSEADFLEALVLPELLWC